MEGAQRMKAQHGTRSVYDEIRARVEARDLIDRLGLEVVRELGAEAACRPLCHESTSGESLHVNLHTGKWMCRACQPEGIYGDLIQLVEHVRSGGRAPTHGKAQGDSAGHREAIDWLAQEYGIALPEATRREDPGLEVVHLVAMHAHEYLLANPEVLEWIEEKWGFDRDLVESYAIGFLPVPLPAALALEAERRESRQAFAASGIGFYSGNEFVTRFAGRVTFPYLEAGRAVYLIGRSTLWTPRLDDGREPPKYHKLTVHSDKRQWISPKITNSHLYNEPILRSANTVVVAEGVADAVALSSLGVPVVSPVTISFSASDLDRFVGKVRENGISRVEILFDDELSGSGNAGARRTALKLCERGLTVRVLSLTLGASQIAARREVEEALGSEVFADFLEADPRRRKEIIGERLTDLARREWVETQIAASKIDAAEWVAQQGPRAAVEFDTVRRAGRDAIALEIEFAASAMDCDASAEERIEAFELAIDLAAHVDDSFSRATYAGLIASAAGKGITKALVASQIAQVRREIVKPKRKEEKATEDKQARELPALTLPPPTSGHVQPSAPKPPTSGDAPAAPLPPEPEPEHDRFAGARASVLMSVDAKVPEEQIGQFVAQAIVKSMGYTPFLTPDDLYLVRGNERVPVGLRRRTPEFCALVYLVSGLTSQKTAHRSYIEVATYHLQREARKAEDVSWSHVDASGAVWFPTGGSAGTLVKIEPGELTRTRMAEVKVPAVSGRDWSPIRYQEAGDGISEAIAAFRWTSLSEPEAMVLLYWIACLPILRRIGTVPILRIEGGSSSGKTRVVDAVSMLVNGRKASSVPTAAALVSRMASEMLTIDDNREADDVTPAFLGTLLQATSLGAREKRRQNSDTGTVIERVCGALLMNGIEPIHSGKSELASRMMVLRCDSSRRSPDSPAANSRLFERVLALRDRYWSESFRRCARALELDREHGEHLGAEIEALFHRTRIGRLSAYLRAMYLAWVAGHDLDLQADLCTTLAPVWRSALEGLGQYSLDSLVREELAVSALRYALSYCGEIAEPPYPASPERMAIEGKYRGDVERGDEALGPITAPQLARLVRTAARHLNGPRALAVDLRAGQLEARILDGLGFLEEAGIEVEVAWTNAGKARFTFYRGRDGDE